MSDTSIMKKEGRHCDRCCFRYEKNKKQQKQANSFLFFVNHGMLYAIHLRKPDE